MSDKEELDKLKRTFEDFIATSGQLQQSYELLKEESQRLSLYLSNILENMNSAILVFDKSYSLNLWNGRSREYFPALRESRPPLALEDLARDAVVDIASILENRQETGDNLTEWEAHVAGTQKWLEVVSSDFMNARREKTGYLVVIDDKTEFKKLQIKSQQEDRLRVMGELAAEVAHEIRNPLGSIELMVTMLQDDLKDDEGHSEVLSRIRTSVDNMNHIVTNILLYTREINIERSEFSVDDLVTHAESVALKLIVKKNITLEKRTRDIVVSGDFQLLKQCVANVLINAAQAVDANGSIEISAETGPGTVTIAIEDNGCGIPEEMHEKVFKPFFTTKNTGTGLGLAMVKRVIEAHSGKIYFESGSDGTTFYIHLPV